MLLIAAEVICYARIFADIFKHDNYDVKAILSNSTRRRRNVSNALSLAGQTYCFITELLLLGAFIFKLTASAPYDSISGELAAFVKIAEFGILSTVHVLTSIKHRRGTSLYSAGS